MKRLLLLCSSGLLFPSVHAQTHSPSYSAPGMMLTLPQRRPVEARPVAKPVVEKPLEKLWLTDALPRFWNDADSLAQQQHKSQMLRAMSQRVRYPAAALADQLGGRVQVRLVVAADGVPLEVSIIHSEFTLELPGKKAETALLNETLRVARLLRFAPRPGLADTVVFPFNYVIQ